jgi:hypothetical protein
MWIVRQRLTLSETEVPITLLARFGVVVLALFVAFYKLMHLHPAWLVVAITCWILCMYILVISKMITSGKIRAKGAKSRRKKWFPFFYN